MSKYTAVLTLFLGFSTLAHGASENLNQSQQRMLANLQIQHDQLQSQLQQITGQMDELRHTVEQLQKQLVSANPDAEIVQAPSNPSAPATMAPGALSNGTAQEQYAKARGQLNDRDFVGAESTLRDFVSFHPDSPLLVNARYWLAETYFMRDDYERAAVEFAEAYRSFQRFKDKGADRQAALKAPEILLKLATSLHTLGKKQEAIITLAQLKKDFPVTAPNLREQADRLRRDINSSK